MSEQVKRILVVDDNAPLLGMVADLLRDSGYTVVTACSAEEALSRPDLDQFEIVLTDETMPGITGSELIRQIRRQGLRPKTVQ